MKICLLWGDRRFCHLLNQRWYSHSGAVKDNLCDVFLERFQSTMNRSNILDTKGKISQCFIRQNSCWSQWEFCLNKYWAKTMLFDLDLSESYKSRSNAFFFFFFSLITDNYCAATFLLKGQHSNNKLWNNSHLSNERKNSQVGKELISGKPVKEQD